MNAKALELQSVQFSLAAGEHEEVCVRDISLIFIKSLAICFKKFGFT